MPTYFDAATIERARVLVETTARTLEDIAVELGTSVQTLRNWIRKFGWRRHPQAPRAVPKLPPEKEGPARRIYESGAGVGDLAVLLDCHESYVHRLAKQRGWMRREAAVAPVEAAAPPPTAAIMEIAAGLRDPHLTRGKLIRLLERLGVVAAAEGLSGDVALLERRAGLVERLGRLAKHFPEDPPLPPPELSPEEQERESARTIEEIIRRFSKTDAPAMPTPARMG